MINKLAIYSQKKGTLLFAALLLGFFWVSATAVSADTDAPSTGERLLTIYDGEERQAVVTDAGDVRGALADAGISLEAADAVEPSLDEELIAKNYRVNIYRARPVLIVDGEARLKVMTAEQSPQQIMASVERELHDEDGAEFARINDVLNEGGAGLKLIVDRATPFTFVLYGKAVQDRSQAATVGEMLADKGVTLSDKDGTNVPLDTKLRSGMRVEVWRDGKQTVTVEEAIDFPVEQVQDTAREIGYREVKTPGIKGKKEVTYQIEIRNGQEIGRKKIQSVTIEQPKKQVEIIGAKSNFSGSRQEWLSTLRQCESGGNYQTNTGNGYYGAYQFSAATWSSLNTGYARADLAPPAVQDQAIIDNTNRSGGGLATQNPGCYTKHGLSQFPPN